MTSDILSNVYSIEYYYSNEDLNIKIVEPISITEDAKEYHTIIENDGIIWVIKPTWDYFLVKKRVESI